MNIYQANNLDFQDLLSKLGHEPVKVLKGGRDIWYLSPFRAEKEPSFHIRAGRVYDWVWYDFGQDGSSTILDFIMQYKQTDKRGALAFLDTLYPTYKSSSPYVNPNQTTFSFTTQAQHPSRSLQQKAAAEREFELVRVLPIQSETIFTYLASRCIPRTIASKYFRLVQYQKTNKRAEKAYFGLGMANESGGWEVRSASDRPKEKFKTALVAKDVSLIKGTEEGRGEVSIFEGMIDFASLLALYGATELKGDAIILHGLKLYKRAAELVRTHGYTHIHAFLDNNAPGRATTEQLLSDFNGQVSNHSPSFAPHTDLNDALCADFTPSFTSVSSPHP